MAVNGSPCWNIDVATPHRNTTAPATKAPIHPCLAACLVSTRPPQRVYQARKTAAAANGKPQSRRNRDSSAGPDAEPPPRKLSTATHAVSPAPAAASPRLHVTMFIPEYTSRPALSRDLRVHSFAPSQSRRYPCRIVQRLEIEVMGRVAETEGSIHASGGSESGSGETAAPDRRTVVLGIAGGSGSGKTTVVRKILEGLDPTSVSLLHHDSYYRDNPDLTLEQRAAINYDHPVSLETSLMAEHVRLLLAGQAVEVPEYDFTVHRRMPATRRVEPRPLILIDGILVLADADLREMMDNR